MLESWWHNLILPLQIFYGTGIVAAIALGIETLLTLFGVGGSDLPDGLDHGDGTGMLSLRSITGFFFGFGWSGVIALNAGWTLFPAILIACLVGAVFLLGIFLLMRFLHSLTDQGNLDYQNAIGQIGTVYVTVPASHAAGGQVEILIQGRLHTVNCLTANPTAIPPGTKIRICGLIDEGTLEIEPLTA